MRIRDAFTRMMDNHGKLVSELCEAISAAAHNGELHVNSAILFAIVQSDTNRLMELNSDLNMRDED